MKITESRLRQIIREEIGASQAHNEEALGAEDAGYDLAMSGMPYELPDWIEAGSSLESYFIKGFEQGEHEFGVRHEGEEGEGALDEMYGEYRWGPRGGARGSSYAQGHHAQVKSTIESVIGRDNLSKLERTVPAVVSIIQKRMQNARHPQMINDLKDRLRSASRGFNFNVSHANNFVRRLGY